MTAIPSTKNALRDAAVTELLFAIGMRISELCALKNDNMNLYDGTILIYGKGDKERRIQIGNESVINILQEYKNTFHNEPLDNNNFFINQSGSVLSDQSLPPVYWRQMWIFGIFRKCLDTAPSTLQRYTHMLLWQSRKVFLSPLICGLFLFHFYQFVNLCNIALE